MRRSALVLGAAAVGAGAVVARRRAAARVVDNPVAEPTQAPPPLPAGRTRTVPAQDGTELSVTEHGASEKLLALVDRALVRV